MRAWGLVPLVLLSACATSSAPTSVIAIEKILADPEQWSGKTVTVEGWLTNDSWEPHVRRDGPDDYETALQLRRNDMQLRLPRAGKTEFVQITGIVDIQCWVTHIVIRELNEADPTKFVMSSGYCHSTDQVQLKNARKRKAQSRLSRQPNDQEEQTP